MNPGVFIVYVRDADGEILIEDKLHSKEAADASADRHRKDRRPGEVVEIIEHDVSFISRAEALQKLLGHILGTFTREELLAAHDPRPGWDRLRNYEIESELEVALGGEWCINEWCPFNGIYCSWQTYAPESLIEKTAQRFEREAEKLRADGRSPERMIAYLRQGRSLAARNG